MLQEDVNRVISQIKDDDYSYLVHGGLRHFDRQIAVDLLIGVGVEGFEKTIQILNGQQVVEKTVRDYTSVSNEEIVSLLKQNRRKILKLSKR